MTAVDHGRGDEAEPADLLETAEDDRALLERLRAGEDAAFGELFARHSAAVRRLAFGLVSDRSEVEDLTAEAFFRVLQAIRRGSGPVDNVRGYLLIVARRVAWEWRTRRRDVPVSDEELTHRAGADPDTAGQSTERNLITRAFTSLPERWRSVLWKVEVEGERPAVVATNFGLSANATAALARRARQGLRAAYLQAHLTAERSTTARCRDVLEKLGAYTAGSIRGSERRRIRVHLAGCPSCASMHAELRDVCSALRAHAGVVAAPAALAAGWSLKGLLASAKVQVALAASAAATLGALGLVITPWGPGHAIATDELDGKRGLELIITGAQPVNTTQPTIALTTGSLSTAAVVPGHNHRAAAVDEPAVPPGDPAAAPSAADVPAKSGPDEGAQVVYRMTSVEQHTEIYQDYAVVYETTEVTKVDADHHVTTYTETTKYTKPLPPGGAPPGPKAEPNGGVSSANPTTTSATSTTATTTTTQAAKAAKPPVPVNP
jgi:RNA polymerase sigma factor (sigma-70 family)